MGPTQAATRAPLNEADLRRRLLVAGSLWRGVEVVAKTGSTNADLVAAARAGASEGLVRVAELQTAGRGRLDRRWQAPARAGITMSVLLRPAVPAPRLGWLSLLGAVAVAQGLVEVAGVAAGVKWPNDVLVPATAGSASLLKCAGLLAEAVPLDGEIAVVLGIGINVDQRSDELPELTGAWPPGSLALSGAACLDRADILIATLGGLSYWYRRFVEAHGDPVRCGLAAAYRQRCLTVGRRVSVTTVAGDQSVSGQAVDVDDDGRLVVDTDSGLARFVVGDVHHVR